MTRLPWLEDAAAFHKNICADARSNFERLGGMAHTFVLMVEPGQPTICPPLTNQAVLVTALPVEGTLFARYIFVVARREYEDQSARQRMAAGVRGLAQQLPIVACAQISLSSIVKVNNDDANMAAKLASAKPGELHKHPDAIEVLHVMQETRGVFDLKQRFAPVSRLRSASGAETVSLGEWEERLYKLREGLGIFHNILGQGSAELGPVRPN